MYRIRMAKVCILLIHNRYTYTVKIINLSHVVTIDSKHFEFSLLNFVITLVVTSVTLVEVRIIL